MGEFTANIFFKEMKQNKKCYRCLKIGHKAANCQNEQVCLDCLKPGHKRGDHICSAFDEILDLSNADKGLNYCEQNDAGRGENDDHVEDVVNGDDDDDDDNDNDEDDDDNAEDDDDDDVDDDDEEDKRDDGDVIDDKLKKKSGTNESHGILKQSTTTIEVKTLDSASKKADGKLPDSIENNKVSDLSTPKGQKGKKSKKLKRKDLPRKISLVSLTTESEIRDLSIKHRLQTD